MNNFTDNKEDSAASPPSKTQLKRQAHQRVDLAEDILNLKAKEITLLKLPAELDAAVQTALKIKSRSGLKRQRLYIGKLLHHLDYATIEKQLHTIRHQHDTNTAAFKRLESWRDRLVTGDNQVLMEIIQHFQHIDRQHIHQLVRQAKQEQTKSKPPASARKLFHYLQTLEKTQDD